MAVGTTKSSKRGYDLHRRKGGEHQQETTIPLSWAGPFRTFAVEEACHGRWHNEDEQKAVEQHRRKGSEHQT